MKTMVKTALAAWLVATTLSGCDNQQTAPPEGTAKAPAETQQPPAAANSALTDEDLGRDLGPVMMGSAPEPKTMVALFEKYQHLKSGHRVDTLVMATISAYSEAGRWSEGVNFAEGVMADHSFSDGTRQSAALAKAYAVARGGDLAAAEQALDAALAMNPESPLGNQRDGIIKQLEGEVAKGQQK